LSYNTWNLEFSRIRFDNSFVNFISVFLFNKYYERYKYTKNLIKRVISLNYYTKL
jgi:hypothetical protein